MDCPDHGGVAPGANQAQFTWTSHYPLTGTTRPNIMNIIGTYGA
jgi:hypothetical protein